ncbi:hypothetical protein [Maribacter sp.]|uniref:hypothetical protein n=1 Tax=Maribacter sp. TaxID=1897614 RepID=UPI0025C1D98C|nr:hypothetical protein [Maribacter sp.]
MKTKILFVFFVIFFFGNILFSQNNYHKISEAIDSEPIYLINDSIIGNKQIIEKYKSYIEEISIMHGIQIEETKYSNFKGKGVLFIQLKITLESKGQKELNTFFGLKENSPVYVDGYSIANGSYFISVESIQVAEIIFPNKENKLESKALNIIVSPKNK